MKKNLDTFIGILTLKGGHLYFSEIAKNNLLVDLERSIPFQIRPLLDSMIVVQGKRYKNRIVIKNIIRAWYPDRGGEEMKIYSPFPGLKSLEQISI